MVLVVPCYPVIVNLQTVEVVVTGWAGLALVEVVPALWLERYSENHQTQDYVEDAVAAVAELPVATTAEMLSSVQRNHWYLQCCL